MSSSIENRSDKETDRNKDRFNHHRYQLKTSTKGGSGLSYCLNQQIDQVPGAYAYPKSDEFIKKIPPKPPQVDAITPEDLDDC